MVGYLTCENTNKIHDFSVCSPARHADAVLLHLQASVIAALPMNDEVEMLIVSIDVNDDLRQHGT